MSKSTRFRRFISSCVVFTCFSGIIVFSAQAGENCSASKRQELERRKAHVEGRRQEFKDQLDDLDFEMGLYILWDHKMATAGIIALSMEGAVFLTDGRSQLTREQRDILDALAFVGAIYCISESDECLEVSNRVFAWGTKRIMLEGKISSLDTELQNLNASLVSCN